MENRAHLAERLSRPGPRLRGRRRLPLPSKLAVGFLAVVVLVALLAPPCSTSRTGSGSPWCSSRTTSRRYGG
ncbi:hypothetical protein [Streptomyces sp. NPDC001056]